MMRTNRPLLNEYLWGRWCLLKALLRSMFTFQVVESSYLDDRLVLVTIGDEVAYEYGK